MGDVALGRVVFAGYRLIGGPDRPDRIQRGEHLHSPGGELCPDGLVLRDTADDRATQIPDTLQNGRRDVGPDVHHNPFILGVRFRGFPFIFGVRIRGLETGGPGHRWLL